MEDAKSYERLANDVYVHGCVALALAMAKETGIIGCLCTAQGHLSSSDIAAQLKLKERYVREVLNSLAVAGLVELKAGTGGRESEEAEYRVPPACRQALQKAGVNCMMVSSSAKLYAGVRKCFDLDGPECVDIPCGPEGYDEMDEWWVAHLDCVTEGILETPGLKQRLEKGLKALEVGGGTGRLLLHFAALFPNSHFTLTDMETDPLEQARARAEAGGLKNVSIRTLDVFHMPDDLKESVDWILTANVIHGLPRPLDALKGICQALRPGGHYSLVDTFVSSYVAENVKSRNKGAAALYAFGTFYCTPAACHGAEGEGEEMPGTSLGEEKARELVEAAGMKVLGLTLSEALNGTGVFMCQKAE